jgi:hypothetical protein
MNAEQKVAATIVEWLAAEGWEVYHEVEIPGGGRADIVAVQGPLRWAIEVKTSLTLTVLEQAQRNLAYFHLSSYAVPAPSKLPHGTPKGWRFAHELAKRLGFGALRVLPERPRHSCIVEDVAPKLTRRPGRVQLHVGQKTAAQAGAAGGGYWTPFRNTSQLLIAEAVRKPGIALQDAVKLISHHYSSNPGACRRLAEMIRGGVIADVRLDQGKLYPVLADENA